VANIESTEVTSDMVAAALRATEPYLNEDGHLDTISAREAMEAALHAALRVRLAAVQPKTKGGG